MITTHELAEGLDGRVLTDMADLVRFSTDASRAETDGLPSAVLVARSAHDVAEGIRWASRNNVPVSVRERARDWPAEQLPIDPGL